jgi:hypothetical protein
MYSCVPIWGPQGSVDELLQWNFNTKWSMSEILSEGNMLLVLIQVSSEMVHFGSKCGKPKEREKNYRIHRDSYWRSDSMYNKEREQEL